MVTALENTKDTNESKTNKYMIFQMIRMLDRPMLSLYSIIRVEHFDGINEHNAYTFYKTNDIDLLK